MLRTRFVVVGGAWWSARFGFRRLLDDFSSGIDDRFWLLRWWRCGFFRGWGRRFGNGLARLFLRGCFGVRVVLSSEKSDDRFDCYCLAFLYSDLLEDAIRR